MCFLYTTKAAGWKTGWFGKAPGWLCSRNAYRSETAVLNTQFVNKFLFPLVSNLMLHFIEYLTDV